MPAEAPLSLVTVDESSSRGRMLLDTFINAWRKGYVQCGDKKVSMPVRYRDLAQPILDLGIRDDDVWVVSHPKTGGPRFDKTTHPEKGEYYQNVSPKISQV